MSFVDQLFEESGRGALLVATEHVEEHLTLLIKEVFPPDMSKTAQDRLLNYPGHLSTFAAKMELAYTFRIISKIIYDCLKALKKLRNDAAHSKDSFNLQHLKQSLRAVYNFGPEIGSFVADLSEKTFFQFHMDSLRELIAKREIPDDIKNDMLEKVATDPGVIC